MAEIGRRQFLGLAGAAAVGLVAVGLFVGVGFGPYNHDEDRDAPHESDDGPPAGRRRAVRRRGRVMMENRSFDHLLGWLPGADGKQAGSSYADVNGVKHLTHRLAPDFQGCRRHDPRHDWQSVQRQFNDGKCDGWLRTAPAGDTFPIGYYTDVDLPITAALARGHTTLDRYFCSVMGPTGPNRSYVWSATTDAGTFDFPGALTGAGEPARAICRLPSGIGCVRIRRGAPRLLRGRRAEQLSVQQPEVRRDHAHA